MTRVHEVATESAPGDDAQIERQFLVLLDLTPADRVPAIRQRSVAAEADAVFVAANAIAACPEADSAEPALKPNHPNHNIPVPRMTNGMLAGVCGSLA